MIINNESLSKKSFKGKLVIDFVPSNHEEDRCKEIAIKLQETYINYLLSILKRNGYNVIERAWGIHKEAIANGERIYNQPAYFNGIIKKLTSEQ